MQYFNFSRLINKYKSDFTCITLAEGYFNDAGDWVKGETVLSNMSGAIISHTDLKIFRSEGTLTEKDKRLFMLKPIDNKLIGAKVIHEGNAYSLNDCLENAKFTGVYVYTLKYISAFKDVAPEYDLTEDLERLEKRLDGTLVDEGEIPPDTTYTDESLRLAQRLGGESID